MIGEGGPASHQSNTRSSTEAENHQYELANRGQTNKVSPPSWPWYRECARPSIRDQHGQEREWMIGNRAVAEGLAKTEPKQHTCDMDPAIKHTSRNTRVVKYC